MSTVTWNTGTDFFRDPNAWDDNQVPGGSDDAVIGGSGALAVFVVNDDNIGVNSLTITNADAQFNMQGGSFATSGDFTAGGDIYFDATNATALSQFSIGGDLTNSNDVTLVLGTLGDVNVTGNWTNNYSAEIGGASGGVVSVGHLDNSAGVIFSLTGDADSNHDDQLILSLGDTPPATLEGNFAINGNAEIDYADDGHGGQVTNIDSNSSLLLDGANAQINITGQSGFDSGIDLTSSAGTLNIAGGAMLSSSGDFENTGTLNIFADPTYQTGSTFNIGGDFTNGPGGAMGIDGSGNALAVTGSVTNTDGDRSTAAGDIHLINGASLTAASFDNIGTVEIDSSEAADSGSHIHVTGDFTNETGGEVDVASFYDCGCSTMDPPSGSAGGSTLTVDGTLTNDGYLQLGNYAMTSDSSVTVGHFVNTGTLDMESGTGIFTFDTGATVAPATLDSTLLVGGILQYASGAISAIDSNGELVLDGAGSEVDDKGVLGNSALALTQNDGLFGVEDGASYTTPGSAGAPQSFANSGSAALDVSNGSSLTISGDLINDANAQVTVDSGPDLSDGSTLTINGAFTNNGTAAFGFSNDTAVNVSAASLSNGLSLSVGGGTAATTFTVAGAATTSGLMTVFSGGVVSATSLDVASGGVLLMDGGTVSAPVTIEAGGIEAIYPGFSASAPTINGGLLDITPTASVTGNIAFTASGGTLEIDDTAMPANEIDGFDPSTASIDLTNVNYDPTNQLTLLNDGTHQNVLELVTTAGHYDLQLDPNTDYSGDDFETSDDGNGGTMLVCFATGTLIRTPRGDVAIEDLVEGEGVLTTSGEIRAIQWIGKRRTNCARHPRPKDVWPILVEAGALGANLPEHDLYLTPYHALALTCVSEVLVPAHCLYNGTSIRQVEVDEITYWHVELESHDIIIANGAPAESYLDTGNRSGFENNAGPVDLHPDFRPATGAAFCRPLVTSGPILAALRASLPQAVRAAAA